MRVRARVGARARVGVGVRARVRVRVRRGTLCGLSRIETSSLATSPRWSRHLRS